MWEFILGFIYHLLPAWAWWIIAVFALLTVVGALWKLYDLIKGTTGWLGVVGVFGIIGTVVASLFLGRSKEDQTPVKSKKPQVVKRPKRQKDDSSNKPPNESLSKD